MFACAYVCGVSRSIVRATWFGCVLHSHLGTGCTKKIEPFSPKRTRGREMLHKYGSKPVQRLRFLTPTVRCVLRRKVLSAHAFRCFTMWQLDAGSSHAAQYIFLAVLAHASVASCTRCAFFHWHLAEVRRMFSGCMVPTERRGMPTFVSVRGLPILALTTQFFISPLASPSKMHKTVDAPANSRQHGMNWTDSSNVWREPHCG